MLRFDEIVFGPIKSRRLGSSLGINLLPASGKLCNFDCIYCECGWNKDGRTSDPMPDLEQISLSLENKLKELSDSGAHVDSITFAGHGEPTLHPQFPQIIDRTVELRDAFFPSARISVLSNATTLDDEKVLAALKKVDNPILKLDVPSAETAKIINRPQLEYDVEKIVERMMLFGGDFIIQTMFLGGAALDYRRDGKELEQWKDIIRRLHPRLVQIYSLDRPAPDAGLEKLDRECMRGLLQDLIEEKINIEIF